MGSVVKYIIVTTIICALLIAEIDAKKKSKKNKQMILRKKETNAINFIRLAVMRLIYGIATRIGLGEQISEALDGAFVPPGVDDDYADYGGGGAFGGFFGGDREDYDYR